MALKDHILKGKREFILPNGQIAIIPNEWFGNLSGMLSFSTSEDEIQLEKHHLGLLEELQYQGGKYLRISDKLEKIGTRIERKGAVNPINSVRPNVWRYAMGQNDTTKHPAVFPEKLAADHIWSWSNEFDLVYDPFMGSGTTAKMAHVYKRNWIGSEISSEYVDLANKRLDPYLRQTSLF